MQPLGEMDTTRREYRLRAFQKLVYVIVAACFLFFAGFQFKWALLPSVREFVHPLVREFVLVSCSLPFIGGLFLVWRALRSRLILEGDWIELRSALRTFRANRNEIEGLRNVSSKYDRWTRIFLKEDRGYFDVSKWFTGNDDLNEWLKGLPDLDQSDPDQVAQQVGNQDSSRGT